MSSLAIGYPESKTSTFAIGFHGWMALAVTGMLLSLSILFRMEGISYLKTPDYLPLIQKLAGLGFIAAYCQWAKVTKLRDACFLMTWGFILSDLLVLPSYVAARTGLPLQDGLFTTMDQTLGIDVGLIVRWVHQHAFVNRAAEQIYSSMEWLVAAAAILPAMAGKAGYAKRFLVSALLAAVIGSALFAILPAAGPWEGYSFTPYPNQPLASAELRMMRTAGPVAIDPATSCGLIAFPSFHVALSILAAAALWGFRWLRVPAIMLASLITLSTMAVGWHYGMDVLGGIGVAVISLRLSYLCIRQAT